LGHIVAQQRIFDITANSVIRARIDEQTKNEAAAVLSAMGLTVSDAFRLMMVKIAKEKALPFEPLVPNEETIEAMKAARRGELVEVGAPSELLASLNADSQRARFVNKEKGRKRAAFSIEDDVSISVPTNPSC
jgi:DNA-damage-inducible protein J